MNKLNKLDTTSVTGARLAERALFLKIQSGFNLHPGAIAEQIRRLAKTENRSPIEILKNVQSAVTMLRCAVFDNMRAHLLSNGKVGLELSLDGFKSDKIQLLKGLKKYFGLEPRSLMKAIKTEASATELGESDVFGWLEAEAGPCFSSAFLKTKIILEQTET